MIAIKITHENMPKIRERVSAEERDQMLIDVYLNLHEVWYILVDYVTHTGVYKHHTVLPHYIMDENFMFDHKYIQNNWETIFRLGH